MKLLKYLLIVPVTGATFLFSSVDAQVKTRNYITDMQLAPREHNIDMKHMKLEVSFEPKIGLVKGKVTHYFTPLQQKVDSIFLDAPGITIKEAKLNGNTVTFKSSSTGVTIFPAAPLKWGTNDSLTIVYEAYPRKGIYFIGWNDPNNLSRKQIWTQGQGIDNRHWIPCYDEQNDKLTTEVIVNFDSEYKVLSNGTKVSEKDNGTGSKTWHYKMTHPHTTYLVMLGIGKYDIRESKSASGVPMYCWYYPEWKDRVEPSYRFSEQMMDFFEKEIGVPYPWESYSQIPVQDFMYGAMENTTATLFGDFSLVDERQYLDKNYVGTNAHELAHQWFGDAVTARSPSHHWLQESFATHYNMIFEREVFGQDHFDWGRRNANNAALEASKKDQLPVAHSEAGTTRWYPKGAVVLEMVKYVTGREAYNKSIKHYLEKHKYQNVDSEDLLVAFHETLGLSLDWFWEQWIYRGGEPHYKVTWQDVKNNSGQQFTEFSVIQAHEVNDVVGYFKMPVVFEVYYNDGTKESKKEWIEKQQHTVKIPNVKNKKVDFVLFDPNNQVIKSVEFEKPFEMLRLQALKAEHMLDRFDAVAAMRNMDIAVKREVLMQVFMKEKFHAVKAEIVSQLINDTDKKSQGIIKAAIKDADVAVRKSVIQNVKTIPADLFADYEKLLTDPSYEIITLSLERLCSNNPAKTLSYLELTKGVEGTRGRNVKVKWLEIASATDKTYLPQLVNLTSNSYEFITRTNAMAALKRVNYFDKTLMDNLFDAVFTPNNRLSGPAADTLKYFSAQHSYKKMIADYGASRAFKGWEKALIVNIVD